MFLNRIYYGIKPVLPWRLRMAMRQWRGARRRKAFSDVWPIDPAAGTVPAGWPGWPDGRQFAFILTHDVEGAKGMSRVEQLMAVEQKHGFCSSFNFVPKGEYLLSDELKRRLKEEGFEIGLHGLEHDGKLYRSKKEFAGKAAQIRSVFREWGAAGFRSPLMQHKLAWLHELNCEYDSSTFDTDPFEPEPDGAGTIFPFWVPGLDERGYVELPYTLVQDFNLFKVLGEKNIDIWKQKLDWVVANGGMALLNTHPDYMCFGGDPARDEYPIAFYEEFLRYVREKYQGMYWAALPKDVARYYSRTIPVPLRNTRKKICMVAYTDYERDNRVRRYAETLAERGDHVDVIALGKDPSPNPRRRAYGVGEYRVQERKHDERSAWTYMWRQLAFSFRASSLLTRLHSRHRYDVIHVHNMPDFLVFTALYPKLTGAKLILDIHDIVPELFASKFKTKLKPLYVWLLKIVEKMSAGFVDHVIVSNHLWRSTLTTRSTKEERCSVILNYVDTKVFAPRERTRNEEKFVVLFPGSFQWHQGLDIAINAFALFKREVPNAEFHLYGGGNDSVEQELKELVRALGLEESVKFCGGIPLDSVAQVIANGDLGVVPKRADSFGNEAYSTKIMEFMSQGIPVVISRTKIDSFYFDESDVRFFPSGDSHAMALAMLDVARDEKLRESLILHGRRYVEQNCWEKRKTEYLNLIDSLSTERFAEIPPISEQEQVV
jgi:glycosyltransferase involved in cell wall biosynthesis